MLMSANGSMFAFRKRRERIDWRKLAAVDVEKVAELVDVQTLQENTPNVTFCDIEAEMKPNGLDPNFIKLFRLAQLIIEYLMYSQDCLSSALTSLEDQLTAKEKNLEEVNEAYRKLQAKIKYAEGRPHYFNKSNGSHHKCSHCSKVFLTEQFLQLHIQRRHMERVCGNHEAGDADPPSKTLEKELIELKQRLEVAERAFQDEKAALQGAVAEDNVKNAQREAELRKEMDRWKEEQLISHKIELDSVREAFLNELKVLNEKYINAEKQLQDFTQKSGPHSNLGCLIDEDEINKELTKQHRDEIIKLKEQLNLHLVEVDKNVQARLKEQENQWKAKFHKLEQAHNKEIIKITNSLDNKLGENEVQLHSDLELRLNKQIKNLEKRNLKQQQKIDYQETKLQKMNNILLRKRQTNDTPQRDTSHTFETSVSHIQKDNEDVPSISKMKLGSDVKRSPIIVQGMRQELSSLLDQKLENIGIFKDVLRVKDSILSKKLVVQENERRSLMKKYKSLKSLRDQLNSKVEQIAKKRMKDGKIVKSPSSLTNRSKIGLFGGMKEKIMTVKVGRSNQSTPVVDRVPLFGSGHTEVISNDTNFKHSLEERDSTESEEEKEDEDESSLVSYNSDSVEDAKMKLNFSQPPSVNALDWESDSERYYSHN